MLHGHLNHGSLKLLLADMRSLRSYSICPMPQPHFDVQLGQTWNLQVMRHALYEDRFLHTPLCANERILGGTRCWLRATQERLSFNASES